MAALKLAPLRSYREPGYPTKESLRQHPEILHALPRRWDNSGRITRSVVGALAVASVLTLAILPLGTFGCVAVSPPVFLTEDEAKMVIEQEARNAGLEFPEHGRLLGGVNLPVSEPFSLFKWKRKADAKPDKAQMTSAKGDTELDGWNPKLNVGYKYVYRDDFKAWQAEKRPRGKVIMLDRGMSSESARDPDKDTPAVAVFYLPRSGHPQKAVGPGAACANGGESRGTAAPQAGASEDSLKAHKPEDFRKKRSEEILRSQVRDFLQWLRMENVI
jgi:hypothetical protein